MPSPGSPPPGNPATLSPVARQRSLRLRTRVTLFFALIALFAGSVLIGVTYGFARTNLLARENQAARDQTAANALQVRDALTERPDLIGTLIRSELRLDDGGFANLLDATTGAQIADADTRFQIADFPQGLVQAVRNGGNGRQYATINGEDYLVVGIYVGAHDVGYLEAFPLENTERTLRAILTALALGGVGGLVLASLFGFSTSRRLLRPLSRVADAAEDIASGGLDTRLDPQAGVTAVSYGSAHSTFLETVLGLGVIGGALLVIVWLQVAWSVGRTLWVEWQSPRVVAPVVMVTGFMFVENLTESMITLHSIFWVVLVSAAFVAPSPPSIHDA